MDRHETLIMGCTEAAAFLGVSRQRVSQLWAEHPSFPEPLGVLASGPVWWARDIRKFAAVRRPPGRPKKQSQ